MIFILFLGLDVARFAKNCLGGGKRGDVPFLIKMTRLRISFPYTTDYSIVLCLATHLAR